MSGELRRRLHIYLLLDHDVAGGASDLKEVAAALRIPVMDIRIPVGEGSFIQHEADHLRFPRGQLHLFKSSQLPDRTDHPAVRRGHIKLHRFLSGTVSRIGHIHTERNGIRIFDPLRAQLRLRIGKTGIGKAESEGEADRHFLLIIVAVSHKNAFPVLHPVPFSLVVQIGRIVLQLIREGFRELSAGIHPAVQDIRDRRAHGLSAQIGFQNTLYLIRPGHFHRRTVMKHHNGVGLHGGYTADQFVLALRHAHMSPVKAFRFKGVRKPGKDHRRLRLLRALHRFL